MSRQPSRMQFNMQYAAFTRRRAHTQLPLLLVVVVLLVVLLLVVLLAALPMPMPNQEINSFVLVSSCKADSIR